jgi:hypothetical protein
MPELLPIIHNGQLAPIGVVLDLAVKMSLQTELKSLARLVAKEMAAGKPSRHAAGARDFMEINPDAVLGVIGLIHREAGGKKPNGALIHAYGFMFYNGMEFLRYRVEGRHEWAGQLVEAVRKELFLLAETDEIAPEMLMFLLNGFIEAKLDPGEDLTNLLGTAAVGRAAGAATPEPPNLAELFESVVEQSGGNEFEVHAGFMESSQTLPPEIRQTLVEKIVTSDHPVLQDTGILFLLDPASQVRRAVCQMVGRNALPSLLSSTSLRRMIALRNWLPEDERQPLDKAIGTARRNQVECASWPRKRVAKILATNMDGAGAQSVFAIVKEGRKNTIACLLVKQGVGIADAWCLREQTKAEVKSFLGHIQEATDCIPVGMDFLRALIPHYLAVGQRDGKTPAVGFLEFVETIGIEQWQPSVFAAGDLLSLLETGDRPGDFAENMIALVSEGDIEWFNESAFTESWFESDADVDALLAAKHRSRKPAKVNAVIKSVLEPRRAKWVERFLWTALWLKQERNLPSPWINFFIIGRELHNGRPVKDIAVMRDIAEVTVMVGTGPGFQRAS